MAAYYTPGTPAVKLTLARAENIATELTTLESAFNKIPEQVSLEQDRVAYALDTGAADAYLVAMPNTWTAYTTGASLRMKAVNANTGASTVNVDGLGVKSIKRFNGDALLAGDIPADSVLEFYYDGTNFQLAGGPATITNAVIGPASSTDNAVMRFNGTSGKAAQDSGVTIDDSDNLDVPGALTLGTVLAVAEGGTGAATAGGARTNLELVIGTDVLAPTGDGSGVTAIATGSTSARSLADHLGDVVSLKNHGATGGSDENAKFQAAIDDLPANGGIILCPAADYSSTVTSGLNAGTKEIVWIGYDATMPSGLPGVTHTLGTFSTKIVQAESARNGEIFHRIDVGDRAVGAGEIDRIFHVVGQIPEDAGISTQRELHAYAFELETDHHENNGGDIRGLKGICRGDGAAAARTSNIRAIHVAAEGFNGHAGDLTGILASVMHTDETNGVHNPIATSVAVIGQVRAGCLGVFEARADAADQKPSFAYRIRGGANALLPELAVYDMHAGGNGLLFRCFRDEDSTDKIFAVDNNARIMARGYSSGRRVIADDAVITITQPAANGSSGFIEVWGVDVSQGWGKAYYRCSGTALMQEAFSGTGLTFTTGSLTGTTGVDGQITVSAINDGTIDIENRDGASRTIAWAFITTSEELGQLT